MKLERVNLMSDAISLLYSFDTVIDDEPFE